MAERLSIHYRRRRPTPTSYDGRPSRSNNEGPQHVGADTSERVSLYPNVCNTSFVSFTRPALSLWDPSRVIRYLFCVVMSSHRVHGSVVTISVLLNRNLYDFERVNTVLHASIGCMLNPRIAVLIHPNSLLMCQWPSIGIGPQGTHIYMI